MPDKEKQVTIDETIKNQITLAVDGKFGNDEINACVTTIMASINRNFLHLSKPILMVYAEKNKEEKTEIHFHLGRYPREALLAAYGELQVSTVQAINYMDFQAQQKANEEAGGGIIVPGGNGKNRIKGDLK